MDNFQQLEDIVINTKEQLASAEDRFQRIQAYMARSRLHKEKALQYKEKARLFNDNLT